MRVSARQGSPEVNALADTTRPIRMHLCGTTYRMEPYEAIALANMLADAVDDLRVVAAVITESDTKAGQ